MSFNKERDIQVLQITLEEKVFKKMHEEGIQKFTINNLIRVGKGLNLWQNPSLDKKLHEWLPDALFKYVKEGKLKMLGSNEYMFVKAKEENKMKNTQNMLINEALPILKKAGITVIRKQSSVVNSIDDNGEISTDIPRNIYDVVDSEGYTILKDETSLYDAVLNASVGFIASVKKGYFNEDL